MGWEKEKREGERENQKIFFARLNILLELVELYTAG